MTCLFYSLQGVVLCRVTVCSADVVHGVLDCVPQWHPRPSTLHRSQSGMQGPEHHRLGIPMRSGIVTIALQSSACLKRDRLPFRVPAMRCRTLFPIGRPDPGVLLIDHREGCSTRHG